MRKQARITSKGQITVPHEIRRALGLRPGDNLLFEFRGIGTPGIPRGRKAVIRWLRDLREP